MGHLFEIERRPKFLKNYLGGMRKKRNKLQIDCKLIKGRKY